MAQSGSAPALGAGCRGFKSLCPDQILAVMKGRSACSSGTRRVKEALNKAVIPRSSATRNLAFRVLKIPRGPCPKRSRRARDDLFRVFEDEHPVNVRPAERRDMGEAETGERPVNVRPAERVGHGLTDPGLASGAGRVAPQARPVGGSREGCWRTSYSRKIERACSSGGEAENTRAALNGGPRRRAPRHGSRGR